MAALAHAAGAAAPLASLLDDRRGAIVVLRKSFAEIHLDQPCVVRMLKSEVTLSMAC
jgi:hypothetical protein